MSVGLNTLVCDEETRILPLLDFAATFCDELVVVVDIGSVDGTEQIARDFGARVLIGSPHSDTPEPFRPLAEENTNTDWICYLDADEILIGTHVLLGIEGDVDAVTMPRKNYVDGVPVARDSLDYQMRWWRRGTVTHGLGPHSRVIPNDPERCWATEGKAWILHTKTGAERDYDLVRVARLRELREAR